MASIHPSSVVDSKAEIAADVEIGPFCLIEAGVQIGSGTRLHSHVAVLTGTTLGANNYVAQGAILGGAPQDRKYKGEPTFLEVGDDNLIREYTTLHRATGEGNVTRIGSRTFLMAGVHVGHNSTVMDDVTIANNCALAGHVTVEPFANIGGLSGVHQWVRIGKASMIAGMSRIVKDVPPFMLVDGTLEQRVADINAVGLRRLGLTQEGRLALHKACKLLFRSELSLQTAMEIVAREVRPTDEVLELVAFMTRLQGGRAGRGDQR